MDSDSLNYIDGYFAQTLAVTHAANNDPQFKATVKRIAEAIIACFRAGGKAMFAGNGGSAGDAQHIAGEFISRLNFNRLRGFVEVLGPGRNKISILRIAGQYFAIGLAGYVIIKYFEVAVLSTVAGLLLVPLGAILFELIYSFIYGT